eukprot:7887072-Alexandrium_andersonii.AAC.2
MRQRRKHVRRTRDIVPRMRALVLADNGMFGVATSVFAVLARGSDMVTCAVCQEPRRGCGYIQLGHLCGSQRHEGRGKACATHR